MIYVASKVKHAKEWQRYKKLGYPINSTWIDEARDKESPSLPDLWQRCIEEASTARVLVLLIQPHEVLKGALVEVGAALAHLNQVFVVGETDASWVNHHLVRRFSTLEEAMIAARDFCRITDY